MIKGVQYLPATKIQETYGVSASTLRNWEKEEKITAIRAPGGKRLYCSESIDKLFHIESKPKTKICYARVSSNHQKEDLERQTEILKKHYPEHEIIKDIGSGLNWKRTGFMEILERVYDKTVSEIVVLHKDRLCRFGLELVEFIFQKAECKLLVHDHLQKETTPEQELAEDLLSIVTVFVDRNNGKRSALHKKERASGKTEIIPEKRHKRRNSPENTKDSIESDS